MNKIVKFCACAAFAATSVFAQQGAPTGAAVDPTADEQKALEALKGKLGKKKGKQYSFVVTDAGKESEKAARELGALILEVKEGRYDF